MRVVQWGGLSGYMLEVQRGGGGGLWEVVSPADDGPSETVGTGVLVMPVLVVEGRLDWSHPGGRSGGTGSGTSMLHAMKSQWESDAKSGSARN